jgi:hypothetical protein
MRELDRATNKRTPVFPKVALKWLIFHSDLHLWLLRKRIQTRSVLSYRHKKDSEECRPEGFVCRPSLVTSLAGFLQKQQVYDTQSQIGPTAALGCPDTDPPKEDASHVYFYICDRIS